MLAATTDLPDAIVVHPSLSRNEASQLGTLRADLPEGWVVELQANPGMAWAAFVYQADAPRSRPMYTVCRWNDRVGLFTHWMDGSACSALAFTELWPILELILDGVFAATQAHLVTVPTEGWANTQH